MKLFRNFVSTIHRSRLKDRFPLVRRFYSDEKSVSTESTVSSALEKEKIHRTKLYRIDKDEYDSAIENDFITGITISAYNVVRI